jgi:hypothetical protein
MNLSKALMVSLCCLGVAGCSSSVNRTSAPAGGPDSFSAGPLPGGGSSTITVKPQAMYNLGGRKPIDTAAATKAAPVKRASKSASEPVQSEAASSLPEPVAPDAAPAVAQEPAPVGQGDDAALALPLRKSSSATGVPAASEDTGGPATPQSRVTRADSPEVLPVSAPAEASAKVDSKFSS